MHSREKPNCNRKLVVTTSSEGSENFGGNFEGLENFRMTLQRRDQTPEEDEIPFSPAKEGAIFIDEQEASMINQESAIFGGPSQTSISMVNQAGTERKVAKPVIQNISQSVNKSDSSSMFDKIGAKAYNTEVKCQKPNFQNCANIKSIIDI